MSKAQDPRKSKAYQDARLAFLRQSERRCHWCHRTVWLDVPAGHPMKATVDHLVEVDADPALCLDTSTWVVACWTCNARRGQTYRAAKERRRVGHSRSW